MSTRNQATLHLLSLFGYEHLPPALQAVSKPIHDLANQLADTLNDGPELTVGLRHLLDGKDALVRQRVIDLKAAGAPTPVNTPEAALTAPATVFKVHRDVVDGETARVMLEPIRETETVELNEGDEFITGTLAVDPWVEP